MVYRLSVNSPCTRSMDAVDFVAILSQMTINLINSLLTGLVGISANDVRCLVGIITLATDVHRECDYARCL